MSSNTEAVFADLVARRLLIAVARAKQRHLRALFTLRLRAPGWGLFAFAHSNSSDLV
jgi:hypothetical protein